MTATRTLLFWDCLRNTANAAVGVSFWVAMMMPTAWSITDQLFNASCS